MRSSALPGHSKRHKAVIGFCSLLLLHVNPASLALGLESDVHGREGHAASTLSGVNTTDKAAASAVEHPEQLEAVQHKVHLITATREVESAAAFGQTSSCEAVHNHFATAEQECPASLTFSAFFLHWLAANTSQLGAEHEGYLAHGGEQSEVQQEEQRPAGREQLTDTGSEPGNADASGTSAIGSSSDGAGSAALPPVADQRTAEPIAEPAVVMEAEEDEDRHNFALAKDGAKVVASNKEARKAGALLDSDADTFLKNECKADKWVIIELSQVAKMDTIVLSQYELYSSRVKEFEVRGRQTHPRIEGSDYSRTLNSSGWQLLGKFTGQNIKGTQAFKLERPVWLKYLQLRMLSHYGSEAVCALNDVCVYGKSAAEDLEDRLGLENVIEELPNPATNTPPLPPPFVPAVPPPLRTTVGEDASFAGGGSVPDGGNIKSPVDQGGADGVQHDRLAEKPAVAVVPVQQAHPPAVATEPRTLPNASNASTAPAAMPASAETVSKANKEGTAKGGGAHADPALEPMVEAKDFAGLVEGPPDSFAAVAEELLPANSASSAAARHGGSVYDLLVQELKAIKLSQKSVSRTVADFQRNVTAAIRGLAFEMDSLSARMDLNAARAALPAADSKSDQAQAGENFTQPGEDAFSRMGLDKRKAQEDGGDAAIKVIQPLSEVELLQQDIGRFREELAGLAKAVHSSKRKVDAILMALALVGGTGAVFAMHAGPSQRMLKGLLLLFASLQVGLILAQARGKLTLYLLG